MAHLLLLIRLPVTDWRTGAIYWVFLLSQEGKKHQPLVRGT